MLVLARKLNQNIIIDGRIVVKVVRMDRDVVKLGIEAPTSVPVHRQEVYDEIQRCNKAAASAQRGPAAPQMRGDGPPPAAAPFSITRADPALDDIISPDAKLVELARGCCQGNRSEGADADHRAGAAVEDAHAGFEMG